jgi:hypothetical protein
MNVWNRAPKGTLQYETSEFAADVWAYVPFSKRVYKWTVFNKITKQFQETGLCETEDQACATALRVASHVS